MMWYRSKKKRGRGWKGGDRFGVWISVCGWLLWRRILENEKW